MVVLVGVFLEVEFCFIHNRGITNNRYYVIML